MTLLIDRDRIGRHRTRCLSSDIGVVRPIGHPSHVSVAEKTGATSVRSLRWVPPSKGSLTAYWTPGTGSNRAKHAATDWGIDPR